MADEPPSPIKLPVVGLVKLSKLGEGAIVANLMYFFDLIESLLE